MCFSTVKLQTYYRLIEYVALLYIKQPNDLVKISATIKKIYSSKMFSVQHQQLTRSPTGSTVFQ